MGALPSMLLFLGLLLCCMIQISHASATSQPVHHSDNIAEFTAPAAGADIRKDAIVQPIVISFQLHRVLADGEEIDFLVNGNKIGTYRESSSLHVGELPVAVFHMQLVLQPYAEIIANRTFQVYNDESMTKQLLNKHIESYQEGKQECPELLFSWNASDAVMRNLQGVLHEGELTPLWGSGPRNRTTAEHYWHKGTSFFNNGMRDSAVLAFQLSFCKDPSFTPALVEAGKVLVQNSNDYLGVAYLLMAIQRHDGFTSAVFHFAGIGFQNIGMPFESRMAFRIASNLDPHNGGLALAAAYKHSVDSSQLQVEGRSVGRLARSLFRRVLKTNPNNHEALAGLGQAYENAGLRKKALKNLMKAVHQEPSNEFYHKSCDLILAGLGLSRSKSAKEIYRLGFENGVWKHPDQRPSFMTRHLKAQPWWDPSEFWFAKLLLENVETIRSEMQQVMGLPQHEFVNDGFVRSGEWTKFDIYMNGFRHHNHSRMVPKTTAIVEKIQEATSMVHGNIKFSRLRPGTHIPPHCGPSNQRIRLHLGLEVPGGEVLVLGQTNYTWIHGGVIVFDDSFEHEVFHTGTQDRIVMILDFWHPEMSEQDKYKSMEGDQRRIAAFDAQKQGKVMEIDDRYNVIDLPGEPLPQQH